MFMNGFQIKGFGMMCSTIKSNTLISLKFKVSSILITFFTVFFLIGCGGSSSDSNGAPAAYKVTFVDWDGTVLSTQYVSNGATAVAPTPPTREGYSFTGWDAEFINITSDLIIKAVYIPSTPTVDTPMIGVYYMPAYSPNLSKDWWSFVKTYTPERKPLRGWYDDSQIATVNGQLEEMASVGIDFVAWDWYWNYHKPGTEVALDAYLQAPSNTKVKLALNWCPDFIEDSPENKLNRQITSLDEWDQMVQHWIDKYFGQPSYLQIDGKPVVFITSTEGFIKSVEYMAQQAHLDPVEQLKTVLDHSRQIARDNGFKGIYFVGTVSNTYSSVRVLPVQIGFDALSAYNYHNYVKSPDAGSLATPLSASYAELIDAYEHQWDWILGNVPSKEDGTTIPYFIPMTAGWDATPVANEESEGSIWSDAAHNQCESTATEFETHLRRARDLMVTHPEQTGGVGIIYAWNEFFEGSYIEPSGKYGTSLLDAVHTVFGESWPVVDTTVSLAPSSAEVGSGVGGVANIVIAQVDTNQAEWTAVSQATAWLKILNDEGYTQTGMRGNGKDTLKIKAQENIGASRSGVIIVTANGKTATMTVTQATSTLPLTKIRSGIASVTSPERGTIKVDGWALHPNVLDQPVSLKVSVGSPIETAPSGVVYDLGITNLSAIDVSYAYGLPLELLPRFSVSIPIVQNGNLILYLYGIGIDGTPQKLAERIVTVEPANL
jgi:hypothetical protein